MFWNAHILIVNLYLHVVRWSVIINVYTLAITQEPLKLFISIIALYVE